MKKATHLLIFILIPISGLCQNQLDTDDAREKKWSIYAGSSCNYLLPLYDPPSFTLRAGGDIICAYRINHYSRLCLGVTFNLFNSKGIDDITSPFGWIWVKNKNYSLSGVPVFYTLDLKIKKKVVTSFYSGLIINRLNSNRTEACNDVGSCSSNTEFINGSVALFFLFGIQFNFELTERFALVIGPEYSSQLTAFTLSSGIGKQEYGKLNFMRFTSGLSWNF